ncbi:MAG: hypothetical protein HYR97_03440 [Candidatus Melainabacteria bacterium]|nr:hypothetical protein [Candidatus Melainabacteria bacterium]MBI3309060.1 hypothetical protein [Candidatus Melainabacteria bacterium]
MNLSIQKLIDDFIKRIGEDEIKMLENVSPDAAFNYVFFLYKKFYGDYPSGDLYKILEEKFMKRVAA